MKSWFALVIPVLFLVSCKPVERPADNPTSTNEIVAGPMLGYAEHQEAFVWLEAVGTNYELHFKADTGGFKRANHEIYPSVDNASIYHFTLSGLQPGTRYTYKIMAGNEVVDSNRSLITRHLWDHVYEQDTTQFLLGSCAYINDDPDAGPDAYGQDPRIFETMGSEDADFMIWLGDNNYLQEADWTSAFGINYRYQKCRKIPEIQALLANMNHYAIWDDHDYGPNDADGTYELKDEALRTFQKYWGNKTYGTRETAGIFSKFEVADAEFYLMDDRYHRAPNNMPDDSEDKHFFGREQLEWLKQSLVSSPRRFNFRFICVGNQVLNPVNEYECYTHFEKEWQELMDFIVEQKIPGVIFLSGDRHLSEINAYKPKGFYTLLDVTSSPLTSRPFRSVTEKKEFNNPARIEGSLYTEQTYMKVTLSGSYKDYKRAVTFTQMDIDGNEHWSYTVTQQDLHVPIDTAQLKGLK